VAPLCFKLRQRQRILVIQPTAPSISLEQFTRGVLALYALTFAWLVLLIVLTPSALVIAGSILMERGYNPAHAAVDPVIQRNIQIFFGVLALFMGALVIWFFCWGTKCILNKKPIGAIVFLFIVGALHLLWARLSGFNLTTINWISVVVCCGSIVLVFLRRRRLFA
jgi:hypothetical protein